MAGDHKAERVAGIEEAFVAHWSHFGRWPGAVMHEGNGVLWYESPIAHLPYNGVIRTLIPSAADSETIISEVARYFRDRAAPFMWAVRPSDQPTNLSRRLACHGLDLVEHATGMDLDLDAWQPEPGASRARIDEVVGDPGLRDYEELIRAYWSLPDADRELVQRLNRYFSPSGPINPGLRFVAYVGGKPVGKLFLNIEELPARVAIYGVSVLPEARGHGVATALIDTALARAKARGAARAVLHSSEMARPLYEHIGFTARCRIEVHATAPLFGTHHH